MKMLPPELEQEDELPLTPLLDLVFLTLVFFMVTTAYGALESEIDITLPTADSAVQSERTQGEVFINLRADGSIVINEQTLGIEELETVLARIAEHFPGGAVIIRGDSAAALGQAVAVLDACRKADIQNIAFAAQPPEPAGE